MSASRFACTLILLCLLTPIGLALGQDVVYYRPPRADRPLRAAGQILHYTSHHLRLRTQTGQEKTISSDQIERIDTRWLPEHQKGDQLQSERRFDEAIEQYLMALPKEDRPWVRHRVSAQLAWCYQARQQYEQAAEAFLAIVGDNPDTPDFDAIPLVWQPYQPGPALEQRARTWLGQDGQPAAALIAASWLFSGREGLSARQTLERLRLDNDPRIAALARCQLWRSQIVTATMNDIDGWQATIQRIPMPLRGGPYFVVGKALAHQARLDEAALALLHVPILYPRHHALAAESLLSAADLLEKRDRNIQAKQLYQEVVLQYPDTTSAALARKSMQRLSSADRHQ